MKSLTPGQWAYKPIVIIGGGPSLKAFKWERLKEWQGKGGYSLGLNMAFIHNPTANLVLDWRLLEKLDEDLRWMQYRGHKLWLAYEPERRYLPHAMADLQKLQYSADWPRHLSDGIYRGTNAGVAGLCLAYLLGCDPIYLLGFDLTGNPTGRTMNWHEEYHRHGWAGNVHAYNNYAEDFARIAPMVKDRTIINLNPKSRLDLWPRHIPDTLFGEGCMEPEVYIPTVESMEEKMDSDGLANFKKFWAESDPATLTPCVICKKPKGDGALAMIHKACELEEKLRSCLLPPSVSDKGMTCRAFTDEEARDIAYRASIQGRQVPVIMFDRSDKPPLLTVDPVAGCRLTPDPFDMPEVLPEKPVLSKEATLTVVIGETERHWLPARVLEYTLRRNASCPLRIIRSCDLTIPEAKETANRQRTGFSFARLAVPKACGYKGRAVYMDSDMLVFGDVRELLELEMDAPVMQPPNITSVLLYDCAKAPWQADQLVALLDAGKLNYRELVGLRWTPPGQVSYSLPIAWNMLDQWDGETKLLHYTNLSTQPWTYASHPLRSHWEDALYWAVEDGFITPYDVKREVEAGHCGPWVYQRLSDRLSTPRPI